MVKIISNLDAQAFNFAVDKIKSGGVLCFKSDTVYALACDARNTAAVEKIYQLKNRDYSKPIAIYVKDLQMAKKIFVFDDILEGFCKKYFPGYLTVVTEKLENDIFDISSNLNLESNFIGFRIIESYFINEVICEVGAPLAVTSTNISGSKNLINCDEIVTEFVDSDILVIDSGPISSSQVSTVVKYESGEFKVLRQGILNI
jgi:L-threonylcarbamoyladenylate synthase